MTPRELAVQISELPQTEASSFVTNLFHPDYINWLTDEVIIGLLGKLAEAPDSQLSEIWRKRCASVVNTPPCQHCGGLTYYYDWDSKVENAPIWECTSCKKKTVKQKELQS